MNLILDLVAQTSENPFTGFRETGCQRKSSGHPCLRMGMIVAYFQEEDFFPLLCKESNDAISYSIISLMAAGSS